MNVTKKEALVVAAEILEYLGKQWLNHTDGNQPILSRIWKEI